MHAEEVDLAHLDLFAFHEHSHWHSRNRGNQLLLLVPHADQPLGPISWRCERPPEKLSGVIEAIGVVVILNVVVGEQVVVLFEFLLVHHAHLAPVEILSR